MTNGIAQWVRVKGERKVRMQVQEANFYCEVNFTNTVQGIGEREGGREKEGERSKIIESFLVSSI